jgi:hypothetical protein
MPTFGASYTPSGQSGGLIGQRQVVTPVDPGMARRAGAELSAGGEYVRDLGQTMRDSEDLNFLRENVRQFDAESTAFHTDWETNYIRNRRKTDGQKRSTKEMVTEYREKVGQIREKYVNKAPSQRVRESLDQMTFKTYSTNTKAASKIAMNHLVGESKANLKANIDAYKVQGYMAPDRKGWAANYLKGMAAIEAEKATGLYMDEEEFQKEVSAFRSDYWASIYKKQVSIDSSEATRQEAVRQWDTREPILAVPVVDENGRPVIEDGKQVVETYNWQELVGAQGIESIDKFKNDQGHRAAAMAMNQTRESERRSEKAEKQANAQNMKRWLTKINQTPALQRPALVDEIYTDPTLDEKQIRLLEKRLQGGSVVDDPNSLIEIEEMRSDPQATEDQFDDRLDELFKENKITQSTWESERGSKGGEYKESIRESIDYMRGFYQKTGYRAQDQLIASQFARDKREIIRRIRAGEDPELAVDEVILRKDIKVSRPSKYVGEMTITGLNEYIENQKRLAAEGNLEDRFLNLNVESAKNAIQLITDLADIREKIKARKGVE